MRAPPILERSILGFPLRRVSSNIKSLRPGVKENLPSPVRVYVCFLVFNILLHAARRAMKMAGDPYQMIILRHQATVLGYAGVPLSPPPPYSARRKERKGATNKAKERRNSPAVPTGLATPPSSPAPRRGLALHPDLHSLFSPLHRRGLRDRIFRRRHSASLPAWWGRRSTPFGHLPGCALLAGHTLARARCEPPQFLHLASM